MLLVFDVDGTLTPSRGRMDAAFKSWFKENAAPISVLVTGSDPEKTREQIGDDLFEEMVVYNCAGNQVSNRGIEVSRNEWDLPDGFEDWLMARVDGSPYPIRTGRHVEKRVGLVNLSVVGRNATQGTRKHYHDWDARTNERETLAAEISRAWPGIDATVAGETGIDIYPTGRSKSQLASLLAEHAPLHFFGDRMDSAGNDHGLAMAIIDRGLGHCYHVRDWQDTWERLSDLLGTDVTPDGLVGGDE